MRTETVRTHQTLVASALELIERDLESDLGLDRLARRLAVSPFHFHRMFSAIVGEPPAAYVRRLRLERAALRIKHTRRPITDIAFQAGYETHEAFTRAFKSTFGVPPREFRAQECPLAHPIDIQPRIVRVAARRIAYVRHVGPYGEIGTAFEQVLEWARPRGLAAGATLLGVYWDDQSITPPQRTRCEVGLIVADDAIGAGEVGVRRLAGGDYVVFSHRGSSRDRRRSYDQLYARWLPERGLEPAEQPPFELYSAYSGDLEGIDQVTNVHVPLAPRRAA